MRRTTIFTILFLACFLTACGGGGQGGESSGSNLDGPPAEILSGVLEEAAKRLPPDSPMPACFDQEVTSETSQNTIGVSPEDFERYVVAATASTAAISTFPHEISLIQAKDAPSAAEIKKLIAGDGGFNSMKWICVWPEESVVIESGSYVLLVASRAGIAEAVLEAFTEAAGTVGESDTFFRSEAGAGEGGLAMGGGMGISIEGS